MNVKANILHLKGGGGGGGSGKGVVKPLEVFLHPELRIGKSVQKICFAFFL